MSLILNLLFLFDILIPYLDSSNILHFSCGYLSLFTRVSKAFTKDVAMLYLDIQ